MTRILFVGDLAPTGFGTVTQDLGRALLNRGEDVRFVSQNELGELPEPFASRTFVLSEDRAGWLDVASRGKLTMAGIIDGSLWKDHWQAEAVVILGDFYSARGIIFLTEEGEAAFRSVPTFHYVPVEGGQLSPAWKHTWDIAQPVAMSNFGADEIARVIGYRPPMVYHGVDTEAFWPVSAKRPIRLGSAVLRSKGDCKRYFSINPDFRVMLRVDTNMPRKQYPSLFRAIAPVLAERPDAALIFSCRSADEGGDIRDSLPKYPESIRRRMVNLPWKDRGFILPRETLNALYNAADLYVSNSAEGFGLTIAEAIACGVPAVGVDYSAVPEVIGPAGRVAPVDGLIDNPYGHVWSHVNEREFGRLAGELLDDHRERGLLAAKGPFHVARNFSWAAAAEQFAGLVSARQEVAA